LLQKVDFLVKKFAKDLPIVTFVRLLQLQSRAEIPVSNKPGTSPAHVFNPLSEYQTRVIRLPTSAELICKNTEALQSI